MTSGSQADSTAALVGFRLMSGAGGGMAQWLVLRPWFPAMRVWVLVTSIGSAFGFFCSNWIGAAISATPEPGILGTLEGMMSPPSLIPQFLLDGIFGLALGMIQSLALGRHVLVATGWILASGGGMMAASIANRVLFTFLGSIGVPVQGNENPIFWAIVAFSTLSYAALTGPFWIWRLRSSQQ
jgi:hypothetical protein